MFSRLFNQSLPAPSEEQQQTILKDTEITITSEIISAAYEPRFKLFALGSCTGDFYVINNKNYCYSYFASTVKLPILKIIPLTNSSTFFSICSYSLFERHTSQNKPKISQTDNQNQNNSNRKLRKYLNEIPRERIANAVTHWVVSPTGKITPRLIKIRFDIVDAAVSPIHPEFVLLLTKEGSLYGFSVEEMKFTDLYMDVFEKKPVKSIFCSSRMEFLVCHDTIEKLDIQSKELSKGPNFRANSIDAIEDNILSIIDHQNQPKMIKGSKIVCSFEAKDKNYAVCSSVINEKDFTFILRSENGDSIYLNDKLKLDLNGDFLVPSIMPIYNKPFLRQECQRVTYVTDYGRFVGMNGSATDHFVFDVVNPNSAFIDKFGRIYVFCGVEKSALIFENKNFVGMYKYEHPIPLAALNNSALFIEDKPLAQQQQNPQQQQQQQQNPQQQQQQNPQQQQQNPQQQLKEGESEEKKEENQNQEKNENEERKNEVKLNKNEKNIVVVDLKTNEKKILFTGNIISKQITREFIDFIVDSNIIVRIDLVNKDKFDIELIEEPSADDQKSSNSDKFYKILIDLSSCFAWKIFNSTNFAFLLKDNFSLVVVDSSGKTQKVETCEKNETVILFDIIDDHGKPNYRNGSFILVVTSAHVSIFVVDQKSGKIKRVRHVSTSSVVIEASITSWGILLLRMLTSVQMITLPDPSYSAIGTLPIDEMTSKATLIKYEGLICFEAENNLVTIYLRDDDLPPCFSPAEHPPIEPPKSTGMKKLFGKKTATLQEADESFQYKRAPEKNPAGTIAETQEIMQQLLSKAAERGDALNELEIKAEHLMKSAQMFRKNVRKFRK